MSTPTREAQANAVTIEQVPAALLSPADRAAYIARALAGEDVYAYWSAAGWNIWIGDEMDMKTGYRGVRHYLGEEAL